MKRTATEYLLTIALVLALASVVFSMPVVIVVDDPRNMPTGVIAHTTISGGRCILTFTPESVRRPDVVAHERLHCLLDADVIGEHGWTGITREEERWREARVVRLMRGKR